MLRWVGVGVYFGSKKSLHEGMFFDVFLNVDEMLIYIHTSSK